MKSVLTSHARTLNARRAPRCQHLKANGDRCGSPALSGHDLCYFHQKATADERPERFPVLEDANAIQVAVMMVMDAVYRHYMPHKTAAILLYGLQIASANLRYLRLEPQP